MLQSQHDVNNVDIIEIDSKIKKKFEEEKKKIDEYKEKLNELKKGSSLVMRSGLKEKIIKTEKELSEYIYDLETDSMKNFYILESVPIVEKYHEFLKTPLKVSFNGNSSKSKQIKVKKELIIKYLNVASKYIELDINIYEKSTKEKIVCLNCKNNKEFDIDEESDICICLNCHAQQIILKNISSYKDVNRVNISSKYQYDRKIHFRDSINQYGGKQNVNIPQEIYDDLEEQFKLHHLISDTDDKTMSKKEKFKYITKEQISIFLKELNYSKHYENLNLLYYNITGNKPDDISYIEDRLLSDFDILTEVYDRKFKNIDRKNFINTHYVLLQLLLKHRHPCNKEDFSMLKTIDRQIFHENICRLIFEELGWNWTSIY